MRPGAAGGLHSSWWATRYSDPAAASCRRLQLPLAQPTARHDPLAARLQAAPVCWVPSGRCRSCTTALRLPLPEGDRKVGLAREAVSMGSRWTSPEGCKKAAVCPEPGGLSSATSGSSGPTRAAAKASKSGEACPGCHNWRYSSSSCRHRRKWLLVRCEIADRELDSVQLEEASAAVNVELGTGRAGLAWGLSSQLSHAWESPKGRSPCPAVC